MKRLFAGFVALAFVVGCAKKGDDDPKKSETPEVSAPAKQPTVPTSPTGAQVAAPTIEGEATPEQGLAAAKAGAKALGGALKGRLMSAMQEGGPDGAMEACAAEASSLTSAVGNPRLRVGRSTLRLRNPKNVEAPEWVKAWLAKTGERKAEGVAGLEEVVDGTARVLVPLPVGGLCLACHGSTDSHSEAMKNVLASRYPEDKATGYENGDLRGVIWAEFDLRP